MEVGPSVLVVHVLGLDWVKESNQDCEEKEVNHVWEQNVESDHLVIMRPEEMNDVSDDLMLEKNSVLALSQNAHELLAVGRVKQPVYLN